MKSRYHLYGYGLIAAVCLWFAFTCYLYYSPPDNMLRITEGFIAWLPQIAGIEKLKRLNVWGNQLGDRIAFVLAISYVPMVIVSALSVHREFSFDKFKGRKGKLTSVLSALYGAAFIVLVHYVVYWNQWYGRQLSPMHAFMAVAGPLVSGGYLYAVCETIKKNWLTKKSGD